MKNYENLIIEVILFKDDIVRTSGEQEFEDIFNFES